LKKKIFISSVVMTGILAVGAIGVLPADAQEANSYPPIIQRLADRFSLNAEEVQVVFEEERADHHSEMLQNFDDRLNNAVSDGKITEEQKAAILDKHEEMQAKMEELLGQDLSREEMHQQMQEYHDELSTWAEELGIEFPYMMMKLGGPGRGGHHMFIGAN
jgi:DNA repair ATPase RecN